MHNNSRITRCAMVKSATFFAVPKRRGGEKVKRTLYFLHLLGFPYTGAMTPPRSAELVNGAPVYHLGSESNASPLSPVLVLRTKGIDCSQAGETLQTLSVKEGYWRAKLDLRFSRECFNEVCFLVGYCGFVCTAPWLSAAVRVQIATGCLHTWLCRHCDVCPTARSTWVLFSSLSSTLFRRCWFYLLVGKSAEVYCSNRWYRMFYYTTVVT